MPSHNTVLDVPCHANDWLVNKVSICCIASTYAVSFVLR